jgi:hypothetical protein
MASKSPSLWNDILSAGTICRVVPPPAEAEPLLVLLDFIFGCEMPRGNMNERYQ